MARTRKLHRIGTRGNARLLGVAGWLDDCGYRSVAAYSRGTSLPVRTSTPTYAHLVVKFQPQGPGKLADNFRRGVVLLAEDREDRRSVNPGTPSQFIFGEPSLLFLLESSLQFLDFGVKVSHKLVANYFNM